MQNTQIYGELRLFARFLGGDNEAFRVLFQRHNHRIFTYSLKIVRSEQIAEDIAQETWLRVIDLRMKPLTEEVRNPVGLLIRTARNLSLDYLKSRRKIQSLDDAEEQKRAPSLMPERTLGEEIVLHCLERIPFEYRETLVLNLYCGYSFEEIARMLDKSPDAIWARASRARKRLRELVVAEMEREEQALQVIIQRKTLQQ